jgi:Zn-dependent oligopeptidase
MSRKTISFISACLLLMTFIGTSNALKNPLLNEKGVMRFDYTPQEITKLGADAKATFEKKIAEILAIPDNEKTIDNTVFAFESALGDYGEIIGACSMFVDFMPDKDVRDAADKVRNDGGKYLIDVFTRKDIFNALKTFEGQMNSLPIVKRNVYEKLLVDFKRNGLSLPDNKMKTYKRLMGELIDTESAFGKNLNETVVKLEFTKDELKGLGDDFINGLEKTKDGKYIVTTGPTHFFPFMQNVISPKSKQRLEFAYHNRVAKQNTRLLEKALKLRKQIAKLLGYENWADYALETKMAKNSKTAYTFLLGIVDSAKPKGAEEMAKMLELKRKMTGDYKADTIYEWEWRYWINQYKKDGYQVNYEEIKEFFPTEKVVKEMLAIFHELYGPTLVKSNIPVWHPDVKAYEMKENGETKAYLYLDLFPREGKYQHAECGGLLRSKLLANSKMQKPVVAVVMNVSPKTKDMPSLMTFDQYTTLFHEFGHATHGLLSKVKYDMVSGTNTARDFVEVPSTMFEYLSWEPAIITRVTSYYKDPNKKLPYSLIQRMSAVKKADSGTYFLRQLRYGLFDMISHTSDKPVDTTKLMARLWQHICDIPMTPGTHPQAVFGHPMGGYDAQYYSYMWSSVIAADFANEFRKHGVISPEVGQRYRDTILAVGGSYDEGNQAEKFLQRKVSPDALLKDFGLK